MIVSFKNQATEDIFHGVNSRNARKCCPQSLWKLAARKLDLLNAVKTVDELKVPPGNRLERLLGNKQNIYSIRINQQYRICFKWDTDDHNGPVDVEIIDYH